MTKHLTRNDKNIHRYSANCEDCFGLCCVALPYAKSADFPVDKDSGTPCSNLQADYRCGIHSHLRNKGFRGCTVYECFGAGQKVSQITYDGNDWRDHPESAKELFDLFPIMQQLHEMLYYLNEALSLQETQPITQVLQKALEKTEKLTYLSPKSIMELNIPAHRAMVNELLLQTSELVRAQVPSSKKIKRSMDLLGAKLKGANLRGANLRGALLIAADLRGADMRVTDLIGADFRDADISGANLTGSIFLTQAQINSAKGDRSTKLPASLRIPDHWKK
ncbi:pentapeptide repeat-containing protein [Neobacillus sp. MM2021_6]|uniref:pentapeptide repeat-containing protein n=1 Tax=Bacillaceae TaxID=186817 RepID=UPI00140D62E8|nr:MULTISPECIES: pentapeptide repeat-containing protein [Bacillaceae]MBO0961383.1 pentapeptide repeat-containing protein [Neobacillus sp. MM2021_6]NHC20552.1 pentapeptide repeat-containing protein [Bacillus sp. MM2020_4]